MFCKICGTLLVLKITPYGKWFSCPNGHFQPELNQENKNVSIKNTEQEKRTEVASDHNPLAVYSHKCKKCGYELAELIEISCFYSDEENIYRMKCGKCRHTEQLEGKVK